MDGRILFIAVALCSMIRAPQAQAQQESSLIRQKNMAAVLNLHVVTKSSDGTSTIFDDSGTGFIVSPDGYVITAGHVVPPRVSNTTQTVEGRLASAPAEVWTLDFITRDENLDLALLRLPDPGANTWQTVIFGNPGKVPNDAVLYALGFELNIFSSSQGTLRNRYGPNGKWVTSLNINHGDSGGPVFDLQGNVIAMACCGYDNKNAITLVTPGNLLKGILSIAEEKVQMASLTAAGDGHSITQTFNIYRSVDSAVVAPQSFIEHYCLPNDYVVGAVTPSIKSVNGSSRIVSAVPSPESPNCATVTGQVTGLGVEKVGPIVVDHRGSGWLGAEISVTGSKTAVHNN
jgi:S1-C subfamily serine protease